MAFLPSTIQNLPMGTCLSLVALTCSGTPSVEIKHARASAAWSRQCLLLWGLSGLTTGCLSRDPTLRTPPCFPSTQSLAACLATCPETARSFACRMPPNVSTASPAFSLSHCPRPETGDNIDGISFQVKGLHFSRNKAPILQCQLLPAPEHLPIQVTVFKL